MLCSRAQNSASCEDRTQVLSSQSDGLPAGDFAPTDIGICLYFCFYS